MTGMYKNDRNAVKVEINLEPGVYIFNEMSSTGKTRLCNELNKLLATGEPVIGYTYLDKQRGLRVESILSNETYKVILLDRYDMYEGDGKELITKLKDTIIMIDCKQGLSFRANERPCFIEMYRNSIEVYS